MITEAKLTISGLRARAVNVELKRPVQTSGGEIPTAPLVLIDLETENGTTGHAYVFSYTPLALEPLRRSGDTQGRDDLVAGAAHGNGDTGEPDTDSGTDSGGDSSDAPTDDSSGDGS